MTELPEELKVWENHKRNCNACYYDDDDGIYYEVFTHGFFSGLKIKKAQEPERKGGRKAEEEE